MLAREGVLISRQILCQWVLRAAAALKPLKELMKKTILESGNVFIDETPIGMQEPVKGKIHQAFMWVLAGGNRLEELLPDVWTHQKSLLQLEDNQE